MLQGPTLARDAAARVWACEQALRCAGVSAVLAWLPQVRPEQLRRLQMAAQNFQQALFVMRPQAAQQEASPAVLRLLLESGEGADALTLRLLKRRGPPLTTPLVLPARPERLQALLTASRQQSARRRQGQGVALPAVAPSAPPPASAVLAALVSTRVPAGAAPSGGPGALDRLAAPAAR
jgi:protein ImuA